MRQVVPGRTVERMTERSLGELVGKDAVHDRQKRRPGVSGSECELQVFGLAGKVRGCTAAIFCMHCFMKPFEPIGAPSRARPLWAS